MTAFFRAGMISCLHDRMNALWSAHDHCRGKFKRRSRQKHSGRTLGGVVAILRASRRAG